MLLTLDSHGTGVNIKAWMSLQPEGVVNKKLPPSLPPVGVKPSPAAKGGAESQINPPPMLEPH